MKMTIAILKSEVSRNITLLKTLNSSSNLSIIKLEAYQDIMLEIEKKEKKDFLNKLDKLALTS